MSNRHEDEYDEYEAYGDGYDSMEEEDSPALGLLLEELRTIAMSGDFDVSEAVCREKARNVLEATAGDVATAAQLYWDDFLATRQQLQAAERPAAAGAAPERRAPDLAEGEDDDESQHDSEDDEDDEDDDDDDDNNNNAVAAVAARLNQRAIADHSEDDEPPPEIDGDPSIALELRRRLFSAEDPPADESAEEDDVALAESAQRRRLLQQQVRNHNNGEEEESENGDEGEVENPRQARVLGRESVSVSDDEGALKGLNHRLLAHLTGKCEEKISAKRRKLDSIQEECEEEDGYLSDNDWLWESLVPRSGIPVSSPTDLLWGCVAVTKKKETNSTPSDDDKKDASSKETGGGGLDAYARLVKLTARSAMIASDEADEGDDDDDDEEKEEEEESYKGIPRTWLNAGFHLAAVKDDETTTAVGLAVRAPNEDDLAYFCWKHQQDNDHRHSTIPPPYHCRAVTALLSVVTGLLYTGASLQFGGHVSCASLRKPFLELIGQDNENKEKETKKKTKGGEKVKNNETEQFAREFEARLADALSALLFIAAQASVRRKQKALKSLRSSKDPADQRRWQKLQRKLRLVPTCWWHKDPTGETRLPELADDGITCKILVATSYTNIEDLRSYVMGNMRSFTSSGGCALFLETIMRIHGKGAVAHMIRRTRKEACCDSDMTAPLVHCTCDARHIAKLDADPKLSLKLKNATKNRVVLDTTPTGHDCFSIELLSLLLTGRVHSSLKGWSTAPLGLGILSDKPGEVGRGLTRPEKPVWILRGPTCYSVMWLNGSNDHVSTFSRVDRPGAVATLTHWNNWYGERNVTHLRLVSDRTEWKPLQAVSDDEDAAFEKEIAPLSRTLQMLARRRRASQVSADECLSVETVRPELVVTKEMIDRVAVNAEDQKFYPGKHRMWRYDMGDDPKLTADEDRKPRAQVWKSFFSLTDREKLVVETKLGPKISTILWTRWPRATVDRFVPEDPPAIV